MTIASSKYHFSCLCAPAAVVSSEDEGDTIVFSPISRSSDVNEQIDEIDSVEGDWALLAALEDVNTFPQEGDMQKGHELHAGYEAL